MTPRPTYLPSNGVYCKRIATICRYLGRKHTVIDYADDQQVRAENVERSLRAEPGITHVA